MQRVSKAMTPLEAEKSELASRLAALEEDHANLRAETAELRRTAAGRAADLRRRIRPLVRDPATIPDLLRIHKAVCAG